MCIYGEKSLHMSYNCKNMSVIINRYRKFGFSENLCVCHVDGRCTRRTTAENAIFGLN